MVSSVGATGFFGTVLLNYAFEILQQFALLLVIVVGFWVAGWLFAIQALQRSERAAVRVLGDVLGGAFMFTALFQGILYTVLVFMVVGYTLGGAEIPESRMVFLQDFLFGAGYLAALIFGASGATVMFTYYRWRTRLLAFVYGVIGAGVPLVTLLSGWLMDQVERNAALTLIASVGFALVISALLMTLLSTPPDPNAKRKAELRRRFKHRLREKDSDGD